MGQEERTGVNLLEREYETAVQMAKLLERAMLGAPELDTEKVGQFLRSMWPQP